MYSLEFDYVDDIQLGDEKEQVLHQVEQMYEDKEFAKIRKQCRRKHMEILSNEKEKFVWYTIHIPEYRRFMSYANVLMEKFFKHVSSIQLKEINNLTELILNMQAEQDKNEHTQDIVYIIPPTMTTYIIGNPQNIQITAENPYIAIQKILLFIVEQADSTFDIIIVDRTAPSIEISFIGIQPRIVEAALQIQTFLIALHKYHNMPQICYRCTTLQGHARKNGIQQIELAAILKIAMHTAQERIK
jgi:hypothetical protein